MGENDRDRRDEWALVTGGSRGIGLALARRLAADGTHLILVARSADALRAAATELEERHGIRVRTEVADLADPEAPERIRRSLDETAIHPEVLVNNAGLGDFGPFHDAAPERLLEMIRVNVTALTHLTRLFLPTMVAGNRGRILNVASTAAFQPGPLMAVYYATKSYVLSLSDALSEELRETEMTVTCLCPGPTRTAFHARADMEDSRLLTLGLMDADAVARRGYEGMRRGERLVVPGFANRLGTLLVRILPRALVTRAVRILQDRVD